MLQCLTKRWASQQAAVQTKYAKLFDNKLFQEKYFQSTIYAPLQTSGSIQFSGQASSKAFLRMTGLELPKGISKSMASLLSPEWETEAVAIYQPSTIQQEGKDKLEIVCKKEEDVKTLIEKFKNLGNDFENVSPRFLFEQNFEDEHYFDISNLKPIEEISLEENEEERRKKISQLGTGLTSLYLSWKENLLKLQQWQTTDCYLPQQEDIRRILNEKIHSRLLRLQMALKSHLKSIQPIVQVGLLGQEESGKSLLFQKLSHQSGEASKLIHLEGLPMELHDQPKPFADLKICVLDMETIYQNKSKSALPESVWNQIDSDTIVLINKSDLVFIRTPEPPAKMRYKNTPLSPQGDVNRTAFRGRVPLKVQPGGDQVLYGDFGLKMLHEVRLTESCLQECRATLHRQLKKIRGARFWLRAFPNHPMTKKPLGVRMGKGKGSFDHWEAKVPSQSILFEIGGGVRMEVAQQIFHAVGTRLPGKTEFVVPPKEETIERMMQRISSYSKISPLAIYSVSAKTGLGLNEFLSDLTELLKEKYPANMENQVSANEKSQLKISFLNQIQTLLNEENPPFSQIVDQLDHLMDEERVGMVQEYLFHKYYGNLKKNAELKNMIEHQKQKQENEHQK